MPRLLKTHLKALFCLLVAALALLNAQPAWAVPPAPAEGKVVAVGVVGNTRIEEATVLAAVSVRRGDQLSTSRVRRDVKSVYRTGFFDDVRVEIEALEDGVKVVFVVAEKPAIREVRILGNKKINEDDIREVIDIRTFAVANDAEIKKNIRRIRDLYLEKGYFLAEIKPEITFVTDEQVQLTFRVTENRKVVVQRVEFTGNEHVDESKFRRFMQVKEAGVMPWLGSGGTFQQEKLDMDKETIRYVMWEEGYLDAQVSAPDVYLSPDKRYIYISFHIDEGRRYDVGFVDLDGDFVPEEGLTEDAVRRIVEGTSVSIIQEEQWRDAEKRRPSLRLFKQKSASLTRGQPFRASTMQAVGSAIESFYQDQGYAFVNVTPYPYPNPETGQADIVIQLDTGAKYRIGEINITGNDPTFDKVVRRELQINEGDTYRGGRLNASKARIQRLGYFDEVNVSTPRGAGENELDVNIDVSEQPTGSFSLGLGFSNLEQFVFTGNISKNNFLGLGYIMSASVNISAIRRQGQVQFFDPYFLDSRWTFRFNAYSVDQQFQLNEYQRGGSIEIGRYLDPRDDFRLALQYTFEDVGLTSLDAYRRQLLGGDLYRNGLTSTIGINFNMDKRNNRIRATRGTFLSASANLSGGFRVGKEKVLSMLGGQFNFYELRGNFRAYYPLLDDNKFVLRLNSTLGAVGSTDGRVIPFIHRYRAGGINSVRGYQWYSLGPVMRGVASDDPVHADQSLAVGGTQTWINNMEMETPLVGAAGISAVVFFDAGNAFGDPWGQGHIGFGELRFAYGAGVRWLSPIGPLRFEYGIPIKPRPGERKSVFDFSIGSFF